MESVRAKTQPINIRIKHYEKDGENYWIERLVLGLLLFLLYASMAYWTTFRLHTFAGDAIARTFNAKMILFGRQPKMANVGFVWAPLPTFLQVPLVLIPALRHWNIAGNLLTALLGAGNALILLEFFRRAGIPKLLRWLLFSIYSLNPYVILYSINGLSENVLVFFCLLALLFFYYWQKNRRWVYISGVGFSIMLAGLARYDGVVAAGFFILAVAISAVFHEPGKPAYGENAIWIVAVPAVYIFSIWVFFNFTIMNDPFFFAQSELSLAKRLGGLLTGREWIVPLKYNLWATIKSGIETCWQLYPAFIILSALLLVVGVIKKSREWLLLFFCSWSLLVYTFINIFMGNSQYSTRYFISVIPMAFILAAGLYEIQSKNRWLMSAITIAVLFGSIYLTIQTIQLPDPFDNDDRFFGAWVTQQKTEIFESEIDLVEFIDDQTSGLVLVDGFQGNQVMIFSKNLHRFITDYDNDFISNLIYPYNRVDYFLVNKPHIFKDWINRNYPDLYQYGADWAELETESGLWRLYKITGQPASSLLKDPSSTIRLPDRATKIEE